MTAATIEVPCGCVFEAEGEMEMVCYCEVCERAMRGLNQTFECPDCTIGGESAEELDDHIVEAHLGIRLDPVSATPAKLPTMRPGTIPVG